MHNMYIYTALLIKACPKNIPRHALSFATFILSNVRIYNSDYNAAASASPIVSSSPEAMIASYS